MRILLIAEAPPADLRRYFYFDDVHEQDSLFRYVLNTLLGLMASRTEKAAQLASLQNAGIFLIDLKPDPKIRGERLGAYVPDLVERAVALNPEHVITIKSNVCDLCQGPLRAASVSVVDERIPFPGSGRQRQFVEAMNRALQSIAWE